MNDHVDIESVDGDVLDALGQINHAQQQGEQIF